MSNEKTLEKIEEQLAVLPEMNAHLCNIDGHLERLNGTVAQSVSDIHEINVTQAVQKEKLQNVSERVKDIKVAQKDSTDKRYQKIIKENGQTIVFVIFLLGIVVQFVMSILE